MIVAARIPRLLFILLPVASPARAHDAGPVTHSFDRGVRAAGPWLVLSITDPATGKYLAARFSVRVDGRVYRPEWIDEHGIRFTSIHRSKKEEFTVLFARGDGPVTVSLPAGARQVEAVATRGFEYVATPAAARVDAERVALGIALSRWTDLSAQGWIAVDEHVHFDRLDPTADATWLTMMEADELSAGHFMRVIRNGREVEALVRAHDTGPIQRRVIAQRITFDKSGWLAAWGRGVPIAAQRIDAMAHTGAVRILVGGKPIRSRDDLTHFIALLTRQREHYLTKGRYRSAADRARAAEIFERSINELKQRLEP